MAKDYNNTTNGLFDIYKEAAIVGNIVAADLLQAKIIIKGNDDNAVKIIAENFLAYRGVSKYSPEADSAEHSNRLAAIIVEALIQAHIIMPADKQLSIEIAAEEILVRRCMESLL